MRRLVSLPKDFLITGYPVFCKSAKRADCIKLTIRRSSPALRKEQPTSGSSTLLRAVRPRRRRSSPTCGDWTLAGRASSAVRRLFRCKGKQVDKITVSYRKKETKTGRTIVCWWQQSSCINPVVVRARPGQARSRQTDTTGMCCVYHHRVLCEHGQRWRKRTYPAKKMRL